MARRGSEGSAVDGPEVCLTGSSHKHGGLLSGRRTMVRQSPHTREIKNLMIKGGGRYAPEMCQGREGSGDEMPPPTPSKNRRLKTWPAKRGPAQTPGATLLSIMAYGNIFPSFPLPLTLCARIHTHPHTHTRQCWHANLLFWHSHRHSGPSPRCHNCLAISSKKVEVDVDGLIIFSWIF